MDEPTIEDWLDRHHVEIIRTHATGLDGLALGKYLSQKKFLKSLPAGHGISDMAIAGDVAGMPHLTLWHEFRNGAFGDVLLKPDLDTIIWDGIDPDLGHVICDFTTLEGEPVPICPRSILKRVVAEVAELGYTVKAAFELEFFIYKNSFENARHRGYRDLDPATASTNENIYLLRNAHKVKPFMNEVIKRLNWQKLSWESWSDEGGVSQVELNFFPADAVTAADTISRVKQIIYETAVDLEMSVCFMAALQPGYGNGLHVHHSLCDRQGEPVFLENGARSPLMNNWIAGMTETMAGATALLCPNINSFRRLREFAAPPVTATWGDENKTAGLRVITNGEHVARIEHRLPGGDANPYLALAVMLAGGLAGARHQLPLPPELKDVGWGLPDDIPRLPTTALSACEALAADDYLNEILGKDFVDYWVDTRKLEWLNYHSECGETGSNATTDWELKRYFELL